jgi:hypothetical protein
MMQSKNRKIVYKKKVNDATKSNKKVSFRDEKGTGFGIADIYFVEKFKDHSLAESDDGNFACTCSIV